MKDCKVYRQYRLATSAAVVGLTAYGITRLLEGKSYNAWAEHGFVPLYLTIATIVLVLLEHVLLKRFSWMPFVIVTTMVVNMTAGAHISTEWDYYYLAMLGITGIACLYGQFRPLFIHQVTNAFLNVFVLSFLMRDAPDGFLHYMVISFVLYTYSAAILAVLFYRVYKKEGVAQSGLQAFSSLLASTPNLMVIIDDKRRVRYISAPLARFAGLDEKAAVGRPLVDLFKTESLKLMFADILDAENFYSATREIDMNDEAHYFKIIADRLSDDNAGMFIEITDMTEIVLASIEADNARKEAEAANRSKSAFLATMSHEIRTPMNAIIGISEIQLFREDLPGDIARALRQIHSSSHGLLGIINDILDLSKIETGKLEVNPVDYDVASLINDTISLNIIRAGSKPIRFSLNLDGSLPARLVGDEIRIKQILNNVLSNAFKYTDEGTVKLSVSHCAVEQGIELTFVVADTGQGMKPEDLARIFEQYARFNESSNRTVEGTGLGMNITRSLVEMMDGRIDVTSEYGKGSVFTVTILQQAAEDRSAIGEEHAQKLCNFSYAIDKDVRSTQIRREHMPYGRVLVVDDVETNLYVARGLLTPYGLTIETASSGFEAIEKIASGAVYDIVFMDHMMPKMDGIETTRKLRENGYRGTIIALTANAIAGNDALFREHGFEDFISKPIDMRQMNLALNRYIRDKQSKETIEKARVAAGDARGIVPDSAGVDKSLMEIFKRDAKKAIETLQKTLESGDTKLFATTAHAMKSACANIGEEGLSEQAKALEAAGKAEDKAFMEAHTGEFVAELAALTGTEESAAPDVENEDTALLLQTLERIRAACEAYDSGAARTLLGELSGMSWKPETAAALDAISEMVLCSDFDEAASKAAELAER